MNRAICVIVDHEKRRQSRTTMRLELTICLANLSPKSLTGRSATHHNLAASATRDHFRFFLVGLQRLYFDDEFSRA